MGRRLAVVAALAALTAMLGSAPGAAAGGGSGDYAACVITIDPATFAGGSVVTVAGSGLEPSLTTPIELDGDVIGEVLTDETGAFSTEITIPVGVAPGDHTITVGCDAQGNVSSTDITITTGAPPPPGGTDGIGSPLPRTGSDSTQPLVVLGAVAVLGGAAFVLAGRRRRSAHADV